jgi:general stress protein YciG
MARNDGQRSTSNRGFASMDAAKQRLIASKGGRSVPPEKRSFSQDPGLAAKAGRKGGESVPPEGRSFSQNRALAAEAGRKGGQARGRARAQRQRIQPQQHQEETDRLKHPPRFSATPSYRPIASDERDATGKMETEKPEPEHVARENDDCNHENIPRSG